MPEDAARKSADKLVHYMQGKQGEMLAPPRRDGCSSCVWEVAAEGQGQVLLPLLNFPSPHSLKHSTAIAGLSSPLLYLSSPLCKAAHASES